MKLTIFLALASAVSVASIPAFAQAVSSKDTGQSTAPIPASVVTRSISSRVRSLASTTEPAVTSVNNAADYSLVVAPGSLAVVFGSNLSAATASAASIPLATQLGGVTVSINGKNAPLLYVSPGQINLQIPYETAAGAATVTVSANGQTSSSFQFLVTATAVGIFGYGAGHGIVQNADYSLNAEANPAASGSTVVVYLTGIGLPTVSVADGAAAPTSPLAEGQGAVSAAIGGANAAVLFIGLTPGLVGLAQANITLPQLATGDYPLIITLSGHQSTSATISVSGTSGGFQVSSALSLVSSVSVANGTGAFLALNEDGVSGGSVAVFGNYLYICGTSNVNVVNVSNPAAPTVVYEFGDNDLNNGAGYEIIFKGGCAVTSSTKVPILTDAVRSSGGAYIANYDLTTPAHPTLVSYLSLNTAPDGIAFTGNTGFFFENHFVYDSSSDQIDQTMGYLGAADYSNPSSPYAASYLQSGASPASNTSNLKLDMLLASPSVLYMVGTNSTGDPTTGAGVLDVFDISSPANIQGTNQIQIPGTGIVTSLAASGNQLIALGSTKSLLSPGNALSDGVTDFPLTGNLTLTFFDITNPASPVMQGNYYFATLQPDGCRATSLSAGFYALSCGAPDVSATGEGFNGSLYLLDARDPGNPTAYLYASIEGLGGMAVSNGYLYAATTAGANIYKIQTP